MSDFNAFLAAIIGQESGGNYRAVNKDSGALGYAQVMPANVAAWSKEILGYSVTPTQFLNSPALQRAIVEGKLRKYYNQYGAAGAASAWYSGDPKAYNSTRSQGNYPSIKQYVDQVLARMGGNYGYTAKPPTVIDNRVQDTSLQDLLGGQQDQPQSTNALAGVDRNAVGLEAATGGTGLEAAVGGVGLNAPETAGSVTDTKATTGKAPDVKDMPFTGQAGPVSNMPYKPADGLRGAAIQMAEQFIGTPYVWGGTAPGGFDCSGLIQYALAQVGIKVPRLSYDQLAMGKRTDLSQLQPGDLVGFRDGSHVALYLGGGRILEAPRTGLNVRIRSLGKGENAWGVSLASLYR